MTAAKLLGRVSPRAGGRVKDPPGAGGRVGGNVKERQGKDKERQGNVKERQRKVSGKSARGQRKHRAAVIWSRKGSERSSSSRSSSSRSSSSRSSTRSSSYRPVTTGCRSCYYSGGHYYHRSYGMYYYGAG